MGRPGSQAPCRKHGAIVRYKNGDCKQCAVDRATSYHRRVVASERGRAYQDRRNLMARLRAYGLTEKQFLNLMARQLGLCAICREGVAYHIDHDHETGKVRGILCLNCNAGIGMFRDRPQLLMAAIDYLKSWGKK